MSELATRTKENAAVSKDPAKRTVLDLIHDQQGAIERALPRHMTAERFTRIVLTEVRRTPALLKCDPMSLLGSVMLSAQLGLEPGPLGHAYLVPFKRDVTFIIGYKGMVDLARRSGQVSSIQGFAVYEGDTFRYTLGLDPDIQHIPDETSEHDPAKLTHVYAVAKYKDGGFNFVVLTRAEVEKTKARSQSAKGKSSPWHTDYEAMAIKTAVRRLFRWLPVSPELASALAVDESAPKRLESDMVASLELPDDAGEPEPDEEPDEDADEDDEVEDAEIVYDEDDPERPFEDSE